MAEVEINGINYRTGKLNAFDQLHVVRRIAPVVKGLGKGYAAILIAAANNLGGVPTDQLIEAAGPLVDEFSKMSDADSEYVVKKCLSAVTKQNDAKKWVPILATNGLPMFEDELDLSGMMRLTIEVIMENLAPFIRGILAQASQPEDSTSQ